MRDVCRSDSEDKQSKQSRSSGMTGHLQIQIGGKPERLGLREMREISVVAKASAARDFFVPFLVFQKRKRIGKPCIQRCFQCEKKPVIHCLCFLLLLFLDEK